MSSSSRAINKLTNRPYSHRYYDILGVRRTLPVYESRDTIIDAVRNNNVVVLEGETGSGKTTQVPQFLVEEGFASDGYQVCCTQPRRVAAISVAKRVCQEMDVELGRHVGYAVRFDDTSSEDTKLKYVTDGMLLREAMTDNAFSKYSVIILDEAHERTLSTDILMGVLKGSIEKRQDLRIVIMSATLDTDKFQKYFNEAPLLKVPGRLHPVDIFYSQAPEPNYVDAAVNTALDICQKEPEGDILIFLTGEDEIEEICQRIDQTVYRNEQTYGYVKVYPLYGALPPDVQQKVFEPFPSYGSSDQDKDVIRRKVICATNIAETSLTIDGVVYVIDTGLSKQKIYNPRARLESLLVDNISQASAKQRAGRAGRTRKGKCFRLYTKESFEKDLLQRSHPEILRSNLCNVVLQMLKLGVKDLVHFDFMDAPAPETMMRALETLNYLKVIDDDANLTDLGHLTSMFPLDPEASVALIRSVEFNCSDQVLSICAMLSEAANCFIHPRGRRDNKRSKHGKHQQQQSQNVSPRAQFESPGSDHITYLNVYEAYKRATNRPSSRGQGGGGGDAAHVWCKRNNINPRAMRSAVSVRRQLGDIMHKSDLRIVSADVNDIKYSESIRKAILCGYFMQVAHRMKTGGRLTTAKDNEDVRLHGSCAISKQASTVVYHEFVLTDRDTMIRTVSEVEIAWLTQIAPQYFDLSNFPDGSLKEAIRYAEGNKERRKKRNKSKDGR